MGLLGGHARFVDAPEHAARPGNVIGQFTGLLGGCDLTKPQPVRGFLREIVDLGAALREKASTKE
jgi:hypothetical protein